MLNPLKQRTQFLLIQDPFRTKEECVNQAINELVPNDYYRDCSTMFDITYQDVRQDLFNNTIKSF